MNSNNLSFNLADVQNKINRNSRNITLKHIHEAQYVIELAVSAIHIIKKIVDEIKELVGVKQNLDPNFAQHETNLKTVTDQLKSLRNEVNAIIETYKYNNTLIFNSKGWSWTFGENNYSWRLDIKNLINNINIFLVDYNALWLSIDNMSNKLDDGLNNLTAILFNMNINKSSILDINSLN